ncbi:unnamed protein product [Caenorhabditis nigoni]
MRSNSVNVLMIGIAASDLFVMGYLVFQHTLELFASINECWNRYNYPIQFIAFWGDVIRDGLQRSIPWLGISMAVLRLLIVKNPLNPKFEKLSNPMFSVILILVTLVLSILWSLFNYMKYSLTDSDNPWQPAPSCTGFPANHTELQFYIQQKQEVEIESDLKTEFFLIADLKIIPTMMFPILTGLLLIELEAAISRRKQLTATQSQEKSTRVDHTTKLVVWMTAMFMAAEGPLGIFYVLEGLVKHSALNTISAYRNSIGKLVTLSATLCYLTEIFINLLMTIHRVSVLLSPGKAPAWFTDTKLFVYCSALVTGILINLLIPYYSTCYVNFNALTSLHESACAPNKHPITRFQNLYLIWVPVTSVAINTLMILFMKLERKCMKKKSSAATLSAAIVERENSMIRQAFFVAVYLSVFEFGYLLMRFFPDVFSGLPQEIQSITFLLRLYAICSLNFFVYFTQTKSTKILVLKYIGWKTKEVTNVAHSSATRKMY